MDPQNEYENFDLLIFYSRFTDAVAKFAYDGGKKRQPKQFSISQEVVHNIRKHNGISPSISWQLVASSLSQRPPYIHMYINRKPVTDNEF